MSSRLMDTEVGGEQTQYESIQTVTKPTSKESGQLGATSENTSTPSTHGHSTDAVSKERGEKTAENMRYGQAISEQGVGGFTVPELNSGSGGEKEEERDEAGMRRVQGYGGEGEMSKNVGG